jgi:hypothetical protein
MANTAVRTPLIAGVFSVCCLTLLSRSLLGLMYGRKRIAVCVPVFVVSRRPRYQKPRKGANRLGFPPSVEIPIFVSSRGVARQLSYGCAAGASRHLDDDRPSHALSTRGRWAGAEHS